MSLRFYTFCLLLCGVLAFQTKGQTRYVSQSEVLNLAKQEFVGKDVDYYLVQNNNTSVWTVFVDAEPMAGWEHECYTLTYPKFINVSLNGNAGLQKVKHAFPVSGKYISLDVKNRYGANADAKPHVEKTFQNLTQKELAAAQRTYAIILSGGFNSYNNHERYWNDCSFIYQTLVNKYGVPKSNIYPIMSDGDYPGKDMRLTHRTDSISQPLDLDFDGVDEISLAATKDNISDVLSSIHSRIKKDDQFSSML